MDIQGTADSKVKFSIHPNSQSDHWGNLHFGGDYFSELKYSISNGYISGSKIFNAEFKKTKSIVFAKVFVSQSKFLKVGNLKSDKSVALFDSEIEMRGDIKFYDYYDPKISLVRNKFSGYIGNFNSSSNINLFMGWNIFDAFAKKIEIDSNGKGSSVVVHNTFNLDSFGNAIACTNNGLFSGNLLSSDNDISGECEKSNNGGKIDEDKLVLFSYPAAKSTKVKAGEIIPLSVFLTHKSGFIKTPRFKVVAHYFLEGKKYKYKTEWKGSDIQIKFDKPERYYLSFIPEPGQKIFSSKKIITIDVN